MQEEWLELAKKFEVASEHAPYPFRNRLEILLSLRL